MVLLLYSACAGLAPPNLSPPLPPPGAAQPVFCMPAAMPFIVSITVSATAAL